MAEKELGYVELEWTCPKCGSRNPGAQKTCTACGAPQPENVQFEQAAGAKLVTDEKKVEEAKAGADIHCPYCGTRNPASAAVCSQCGGDLKSGTRRESGRVVGAYKAETGSVKQIPCPNCRTPNPETNKNCTNCGAVMAPASAPATAAPMPVAAKTGVAALGVGGIIAGVVVALLCLCVAAYFIYNSMRRDTLTGVAGGVSWERTIAIEDLRPVTRAAFEEDIPAEAQVGQCELRYHHTQDQPAPNSEEVCGTPYTKDTGSGYGEVVQDCVYEVQQDYCEYTVEEWQVVDQLQLSGNDLHPEWPQPSLAGSQRLGQQAETYIILFTTENGEYQFVTNDADLYAQAALNSEWTLTLNGFNQVVAAEPK